MENLNKFDDIVEVTAQAKTIIQKRLEAYFGDKLTTTKPINEKVMTVLQVIGMVLLLSLMAFAFGNDIYKLIVK